MSYMSHVLQQNMFCNKTCGIEELYAGDRRGDIFEYILHHRHTTYTSYSG